jgi:hypothetical protein
LIEERITEHIRGYGRVKLLATTGTRNDIRNRTGAPLMDEGEAEYSDDAASISWPQRIVLVALWHAVMADTPYPELVTGLGREALQAELAPLAGCGLIRQAPDPPAFFHTQFSRYMAETGAVFYELTGVGRNDSKVRALNGPHNTEDDTR